MSVNMGSAVGTIELDISKLTAALKTAQSSTKSAMDSIKQASNAAGKGLVDAFGKANEKMIATGKAMQNVGTSMQSAGKSMTSVGSSLTKNITLPLTALGVVAIKSAMDFEQGMANVASISGATGSELKMLESKALEMGATTKFSATEATQAFEFMAMAGWDASKMVDGIGGIMALAAADGLDLATTSDIVTDGMTAFGLAANESGRFADVLAAASSNANVNVSLLGESFKYVAPVAGALGFSVEDTSVALGLMGNAGIKASQAGTSLRGALTNLVNPTDKAKSVMDQYGISITNTDGTMKTLDEIMLDLRGTFGGLDEATQAQAASMLFGKNAMSGMLAIINASDEDYASLTDSINNSAGAAERMANVKMDTFGGQLTLLKSAFEGVAIQIGNALIPYMEKLVGAVQGAISWFDGLTNSQQQLAVGLGLAAAAAGPLIAVIGKLTSGLGLVIGTVGKGIEAFGKLNNAMSVVNLTKYTTSIKALEKATILQTATMKLAQAAILAKSAITGVLTGQIGLYTAAQWLANAALTAFPVVAVVAGIVAVIAALVKLIMWLTKSSEEFKKQKKEVDDLGTAQKKLIDDVDESGKAFEANSTAIESNARAGQNLVSRLKDISSSSADAETKSRQMQNVVTQLNGTVEGLNVAYDEQTGKLKNLATGQEVTLDQIEQLTNARAELAQAAAWEERAIELNGELARAQEEQIVIMNKIDDINANQDMSQREKQKLIKELQVTYDAYGATIEDVNGRITIAEQQALDMNTEMAQGVVDGFGQIDEATGLLVPSLQELSAQYGMTEEEIKSSADGMGMTLSEWAVAHEESAAQAEEAIADYTDKVANNFEELPTKMDKTADEMTAILLKNAQSMADWEQNISKLSDMAGAEGEAAIQALVDMGTQSSGVVEDLLQHPDKLQAYVEAYTGIGQQASSGLSEGLSEIQAEAPPIVEEGIAASVDSATTATSEMTAAGQENAKGYAQGLDTGMAEAKTATETATTDINAKLTGAATEATTAGETTGQGYSTGLTAGLQAAETQTQTTGTSIAASLQQTAADATAKGQETGAGYTDSLGTSLSEATTVTQTATSGAVTSTQQTTAEMTAAGQQAGEGYNTGLNTGLQTAVTSVGTAMTGIVGATQVATTEMVTSGQSAGQGFAQGLNTGLQTAVTAVGTAMTGIVGAAQVATQAMATAGQNAGQGFAQGLSIGLQSAVAAVGTAMTGIVGAAKVATASMMQQGQQAGQGFSNGLKSGMSSAVQAVGIATTGIVGAAKVAAASMTQQGQAAGKGYSTGIKSGMSSTTTSVQAELNKARSAATSFVNTFKTQGQQAGQGFTQGMKSGLASMLTNIQSELNKVKSTSTAFANTMKTTGQQAGKGFTDAFKAGISSLTTNLQSEFNRTKSAISSFSSSATSQMRSTGSSMANAIRSGFSSVGGWESLGANVARGIASGINANTGVIKSAAIQAAMSALSAAQAALGINSPSKVMADNVGKWIPEGIALGVKKAMPSSSVEIQKQINQGLGSMDLSKIYVQGKTIGEKLIDGIQKGVYGIDEVVKYLGVSVEEVKKAMSEQGISLDMFVQQHEDALRSVEEELQIFENKIKYRTEKIVNSFEAIPTAFQMSAKDMLKNLKDNQKNYEEWERTIAEITEKLGPMAADNFKELGIPATKAMKEILESTELLEEYKKIFGTKIDETTKKAINDFNAPGFIGAPSKAMREAAEQVKKDDAIPTVFAVQDEKLKEQMDKTEKSMKSSGKSSGAGYASAMKTAVSPVTTDVKATTEKTLSTTKQFGSDLKKSGSSGGQAFTDSIKRTTAPIPNDIKSVLDKASKQIETFSKESVETLNQTGKDMETAVTTGFNTTNGWHGLGENVCKGIALGMTTSLGGVIAAAVNIASSALNAAKNALGINSPSRAFRDEVGKWIPLGIADGFTAYMPQASAEMEQSLLDVTDGMSTDAEIAIMAEVGDTYVSIYDRIKNLVQLSRSGLQDSIQELSTAKISGGAIPIKSTSKSDQDFSVTKEQVGDTFIFNETGLQPEMVAKLVRAVKRDQELGFA